MDLMNFSKDYACNHQRYLPCRFAYLDEDVHRCSFHRLFVLVGWVQGDEEAAEDLVRHACPPNQEEWEYKRYLRKINEEYAEEIIQNAKIGDIVYCFEEVDGEVVLLEKPTSYQGQCVYKDKKGQTRSCHVGLFRTLSKGNYVEEYLAKGEDSEIRSRMIKRMAGEAGFRVEIEENKNGHLVKIFGDSKREVDDFMTLCVYNKFVLY